MIVSILQLMGFGFGRSEASQTRENPRAPSGKDGNQGITRSSEGAQPSERAKAASSGRTHAAASAARRPSVKAPAKKAPAKKVSAPAKGSKAAPVTKASGKAKVAVANQKVRASAPKAPVKTAKVTPTAPTKKAPVKAAAKAATKTPVSPAGKPKATPASKKTTAPKAVAPTGKPVSTAKKAAPVTSPVLKSSPVPSPVKAVTASRPAPVVAASPAAVPVPAPKAPKPSARLAQITVPSMAQSVASTAAKSSYAPAMPAPVLVSPPSMPTKKDPKLANNWKSKPVDQLSDAEVMAMPDSEYMNDKQMAFFRLKLSQLKTDILSNAGETTEHLREDTVIVPDPADRATIEEEHALELRTRDRERKLLKKIEQSIARIDAGDYGYCDETGEPIGVGRLLARPTATLSLEAQQRRELKQKMFGD